MGWDSSNHCIVNYTSPEKHIKFNNRIINRMYLLGYGGGDGGGGGGGAPL